MSVYSASAVPGGSPDLASSGRSRRRPSGSPGFRIHMTARRRRHQRGRQVARPGHLATAAACRSPRKDRWRTSRAMARCIRSSKKKIGSVPCSAAFQVRRGFARRCAFHHDARPRAVPIASPTDQAARPPAAGRCRTVAATTLSRLAVACAPSRPSGTSAARARQALLAGACASALGTSFPPLSYSRALSMHTSAPRPVPGTAFSLC